MRVKIQRDIDPVIRCISPIFNYSVRIAINGQTLVLLLTRLLLLHLVVCSSGMLVVPTSVTIMYYYTNLHLLKNNKSESIVVSIGFVASRKLASECQLYVELICFQYV